MNSKRKVVLLGAGSGYFHTVIGELVITPEIAESELVLFDIDQKRMEITYNYGKRLAAKANTGWKISKESNLEKALDGADFAISSIGVHGKYDGKYGRDPRYHKIDCDTAAKFGIIHTTGDTVGPAGLSQGLRIIPIYLDIARKMEKYCPDVVLLNHSNPMAAICRAVTKYTKIHTIGYCHNIYGDMGRISRVLGIRQDELDFTSGGLNHMGWLLDIRHKGKDIYPMLLEKISKSKLKDEGWKLVREICELFNLFPIGGGRHIIEFFPHARINSKTKDLSYGLQWRSERLYKKGSLDDELRNKEKMLEILGKREVILPSPDQLTPETMGQQIKSLSCGPEKIHFVNVPNNGSITNLPDWAIVEVKTLISQAGAKPVFAGELPPQAARWSLAQIYAFELTIEAAAENSRTKAIQALTCDPMIRDFKEATKVFDALVKAQGPRLTEFQKK
jgi:alpha-galactosidase/6-phospho-beta-glucosidase family protein